ncbi:MAG: 2-dehydropantoate 2-reductase [Actinomycetota bacterium]
MGGQRLVAVVGVGAVGGVFAAHLSAVHDVVACVRRPFDRYRVESPAIPFDGPAVAVTNPDGVPFDRPADAVLVGLKAQHTADAAPWFGRLCGPDTTVIVMQNGIEGRERLAPLVGGATVVPSVVYCGAELLAPGHIRHDSQARLIVADDAAGAVAAELVDGTPLTIERSDRFATSAWVKLGINSVANGLTALTGKPMGVLAEPGIAAIAEALLTECWTVGRADGVELDLDGIPEMVRRMSAQPGGRTSMQHDREAGRPTEYDAIHGAVLRRAAAHRIEVPVTTLIHDLLAAAEPGPGAP